MSSFTPARCSFRVTPNHTHARGKHTSRKVDSPKALKRELREHKKQLEKKPYQARAGIGPEGTGEGVNIHIPSMNIGTGRARLFLSKFEKFWFQDFDPDVPVPQVCSELWFCRNPATDAFIRQNFEEDLASYSRELESEQPGEWADILRYDIGTLAVLTMSGRFSHIIHEGSSAAYRRDDANRMAAFMSIHTGSQMRMGPVKGALMLTPLIDAESLRSVEAARANLDNLLYVTKHHQLDFMNGFVRYVEDHMEVLKKFNRYPLRNDAMGRESTPEELEYIEEAKSLLQRQKERHADLANI